MQYTNKLFIYNLYIFMNTKFFYDVSSIYLMMIKIIIYINRKSETSQYLHIIHISLLFTIQTYYARKKSYPVSPIINTG